MALLLTLLVTIILAVVVLEFNYLIRVQATLSGRLVDDLRAQAAAESGVQHVTALLLNDALADAENGVEVDAFDEEWAKEIELEADHSTTAVLVVDEMSKLDMNRLVKQNVTDPELEEKNTTMVESFKRLFESLSLEPEIVDKIVDWIDENDEEEPYGAESSYYEELEPPVRCKNGPMDSIEELLMIEGIDKEILYGTEDTPGLIEFVTVCGDKDGRVNINTAPEEVIAAVLNSESEAAMIVDMRKTDPFRGEEDMATRLPDLKLSENFTASSTFFRVSSESSLFSGSPSEEEEPLRRIEVSALLKRVRPAAGDEGNYFSIDTVSWKVNRFLESE